MIIISLWSGDLPDVAHIVMTLFDNFSFQSTYSLEWSFMVFVWCIKLFVRLGIPSLRLSYKLPLGVCWTERLPLTKFSLLVSSVLVFPQNSLGCLVRYLVLRYLGVSLSLRRQVLSFGLLFISNRCVFFLSNSHTMVTVSWGSLLILSFIVFEYE